MHFRANTENSSHTSREILPSTKSPSACITSSFCFVLLKLVLHVPSDFCTQTWGNWTTTHRAVTVHSDASTSRTARHLDALDAEAQRGCGAESLSPLHVSGFKHRLLDILLWSWSLRVHRYHFLIHVFTRLRILPCFLQFLLQVGPERIGQLQLHFLKEWHGTFYPIVTFNIKEHLRPKALSVNTYGSYKPSSSHQLLFLIWLKSAIAFTALLVYTIQSKVCGQLAHTHTHCCLQLYTECVCAVTIQVLWISEGLIIESELLQAKKKNI